MSDENAEKAWDEYAIPEGLVYNMPNSSERRAFMAGRASRDAEVAAERTRADKAEARLADAREISDACSESLARHIEQSTLNETRLREVIKRASVELHRALPTSRRAAMVILDMAAIPVEPQGDRPHYEIIVPGCDCVGCFGETPDHENGSD